MAITLTNGISELQKYRGYFPVFFEADVPMRASGHLTSQKKPPLKTAILPQNSKIVIL